MDRIGCKCHASNPRRARSEHGPGQVSTHSKCLALHTQKDIGEWDSTAQGETGRRTRLGTAHSPSFLRSSIAIRRWVGMDVWTNNNSTSTVYAPLDQQKEKKNVFLGLTHGKGVSNLTFPLPSSFIFSPSSSSSLLRKQIKQHRQPPFSAYSPLKHHRHESRPIERLQRK